MQILAPVVPLIILLLATFAQPLLVNQALAFVSVVDEPESFGWALFGGFVCVYALLSLSTALYWEKVGSTPYTLFPQLTRTHPGV